MFIYMRWHELPKKSNDNQMGLCKLLRPFDYHSISVFAIHVYIYIYIYIRLT